MFGVRYDRRQSVSQVSKLYWEDVRRSLSTTNTLARAASLQRSQELLHVTYSREKCVKLR
jgi:hypothetical protein